MRAVERILDEELLRDAEGFRERFAHPLERALNRMYDAGVDRSCIEAASTLLELGRAMRGDPSKDWQRDQRMKYREARSSCQRALQNPF